MNYLFSKVQCLDDDDDGGDECETNDAYYMEGRSYGGLLAKGKLDNAGGPNFHISRDDNSSISL